MTKSDAVTAAFGETATVRVVAPGGAAVKLGVAATMWGVRTTTTAARATAVVEAEGGASGAGAYSGRRRVGNLRHNNRGGGSSSGGGREGRRNEARGLSAWDGSLTSTRSSFASRTDHG